MSYTIRQSKQREGSGIRSFSYDLSSYILSPSLPFWRPLITADCNAFTNDKVRPIDWGTQTLSDSAFVKQIVCGALTVHLLFVELGFQLLDFQLYELPRSLLHFVLPRLLRWWPESQPFVRQISYDGFPHTARYIPLRRRSRMSS